MNRYPFKVSIYYRYPTALREEEFPKVLLKSYIMKDFHDYKFGGLDGIIMANVAKIFNFTVNQVTPTATPYGLKLPNNTFIGEFCTCS